MLKRILGLSFLTAAMLCATPLVIVVSGTGSGTLKGVAFTAAPFVFTLTTDTTRLAKPHCCNTLDTPSGTSTTFSITGVGSGTITDTQAVFLDSAGQTIGLAHFNDGDLIDLSDPSLSGYSYNHNLGPITGAPSFVGACPGKDCTSFTTSAGALSFSSVSTVTFGIALGTPHTINTFAGNGSASFSGDGGPATAAALNLPVFVATDAAGNTYVADQNNNRIRKISAGGTISTFAGNGSAGFAGDGGLATSASLSAPTGVFADGYGNVFIADVGNGRIRKVSTSGTITTVAGSGQVGYGGDGGLATSAAFHNPVRAVVDRAGNIYIADQSNHLVRKVDSGGIIHTVAGTGAAGFSGDGGQAASAQLNNPTAVAVDAAGNLFITDQFNHRIRRVTPGGVITTIAGNGTAGFSGDGGLATSASLNYPGGIVIDSLGILYVADDVNFRVRSIDSTGTINTVAGNGTAGFSGDGGPATLAGLNGQFGLAIDPSGNLLIADSVNNRIRSVQSVASVTPTLTSASITNAASYVQGGSAGALATIFGTHLAINVQGIVGAVSTPLPARLAGTSVKIGGVDAPIVAIANVNGQEQINLQIPWELTGQSTATVTVSNALATSAATTLTLSAEQPGVFAVDGVNGAIEHANGALVTDKDPAAPGETVVVFATGLGPASPVGVTGSPATNPPLQNTVSQPTATIGGLSASVAFSGLAPGFVGLNQVNLVVPAGAASGPQDLILTVGTTASKPVKISIR